MKNYISKTVFIFIFTLCGNFNADISLALASPLRVVPKDNQEILLSYSQLVKKTAPAVVNIYSKKRVKVASSSIFMDDPFFRNFFGDNIFDGGVKERIQSSLGSGVIIKNNGFVITSNHVIEGSEEIKVALNDRREYDAKIVVADKKTDLALLKLTAKDINLPYLELADSDKIEVGDLVLAIGNPFNVGQTVTSGIVSALSRSAEGVGNYQFFIQTDAAINPGNSGGALVNSLGQLVGINTAILSKSGGSNGIGFAIPANMVRAIIENSNKEGKILRPWFGATMQPITQEIANSLDLKFPNGALVKQVIKDSPADEAGLKVADLIIAIDGHKIEDERELNYRIATYKIGTVAKISLIRESKEIVIEVKMQMPPEKPKKDLRTIEGKNPLSGAVIANLSPALAYEMDLDMSLKNVVITQIRGGNSAAFGLREGDIILELNGVKIESTKQLQKLLENSKNSWKISILRDNKVLNVIFS